jgi:hypothetical protein
MIWTACAIVAAVWVYVLWTYDEDETATRPPHLPEISVAIRHVEFAVARLQHDCYNGHELLLAIDYAERQLALARRHIYSVDVEERPPAAPEDLML